MKLIFREDKCQGDPAKPRQHWPWSPGSPGWHAQPAGTPPRVCRVSEVLPRRGLRLRGEAQPMSHGFGGWDYDRKSWRWAPYLPQQCPWEGFRWQSKQTRMARSFARSSFVKATGDWVGGDRRVQRQRQRRLSWPWKKARVNLSSGEGERRLWPPTSVSALPLLFLPILVTVFWGKHPLTEDLCP